MIELSNQNIRGAVKEWTKDKNLTGFLLIYKMFKDKLLNGKY